MCDKTSLLLPLRWRGANCRQIRGRVVPGDDREAGYPCSCAAKDSFDQDCGLCQQSVPMVYRSSTYEKAVIGKITTSPAATFPVEFAGSARLLKEAHLKLGSSDSQSVFTAFVNAGGPVKSRISTCFSLVAFRMMSLVTWAR